MIALFAAAFDDRVATMVRFFLIALALTAPLAIWRVIRRARRRAAAHPDGPEAPAAAEPELRDLAWLVREIDEAGQRAVPADGAVGEIDVPAELATLVWGGPNEPADPVAAAVVADAIRRAGLVGSPARSDRGTRLRTAPARTGSAP